MQEWFRINDADTREQVKAKVEKLFERVAELENKVEELEKKVGVTPLIDPKELWAYMCKRDNPECKKSERMANLFDNGVLLTDKGVTPPPEKVE